MLYSFVTPRIVNKLDALRSLDRTYPFRFTLLFHKDRLFRESRLFIKLSYEDIPLYMESGLNKLLK